MGFQNLQSTKYTQNGQAGKGPAQGPWKTRPFSGRQGACFGMTAMAYNYEIFDAVDRIPTGPWRELCPPGRDVFMDLRFLRVFEQSLAEEADYYFVLVRDTAGKPVGAACFSLCRLDAALFCQGFVARGIAGIRRVLPGYLKFWTLFCGLPFSAGQSHLRLAPHADPAAAVDALQAAAVAVARRKRSLLIIFKEFADHDETVMRHLGRLGYVRGDSLPMNCADMRFRNLDDLCASMRSHYRYKIKRSRRKFHKAGLRVEHLQGEAILDTYSDEVHRLYDAVVDAAEVRLERLPARFFRDLVQALPEYVRFTAVRYEDRIVAFAWSLFAGGVYRDLFVGVDYDFGVDCDLYFNLMASDLDAGYGTGAQEIQMGQTADVFKSRLGCRPETRYVCVKALPFWLALPFRATARWLFPPPPPPPARDLFRDATPSETNVSPDIE